MESGATGRVAKNTVMLYFRQIVILAVGLYTVRVILSALGAEDYGIYNVVAGIVTMFNFLSVSMAVTSQRFFSYDLGRQDYESLRTTFAITFEMYVLLAVLVVVLAETVGLWFVNHKLVIPSGRMRASNTVYQLSIISFVLTFLSAPFLALIISHEEMAVYACVSSIEAVLKLLAVLLLKFISFDKLVLYAMLLCIVAAAVALIYTVFCHVRYSESRVRLCWDTKRFAEITGFSGWCLFGTVAGIAKNQVTNVLLNLFFGPIVNAARGIAFNVNAAVSSFANNFNMALRPQVVKTYSSGNREDALHLTYWTSKLTYFMLFVFMLPVWLEMEYVLGLWLGSVPEYTAVFTRLILIEVLTDSFSLGLQSLSQATGKMRLYQSVVGGMLLFNLPVSFVLLKSGFSQYSVQVAAIAIGLLAFVLRLLIVRVLTGLSVRTYARVTIFPCFLVSLTSCAVPFLVHRNMQEGLLRFFLVVTMSLLCVALLGFAFGLSRKERMQMRAFVVKRLSR